MLKLPVEFQNERCRTVAAAVNNDLELTSGTRPLYRCLFKTTPGIEEHLFKRYAQFHSDSKPFLYDSQTFLRRKALKTVAASDIEAFSNLLNANTSPDANFHEKYGYLSWKQLEWMNTSSPTLGAVFGYRLGAPVLSLLVPLICLIVPVILLIYNNHSYTIANYLYFLHSILKNHTFGGIFNFSSLTTEKKLILAGTIAFYGFQTYMNVHECITNYANLNHIQSSMTKLEYYVSETIDCIDEAIGTTKGLSTYEGFKNQISRLGTELREFQTVITRIKLNDPRCLGQLMSTWYTINCDRELRDTLSKSVDFNVYARNQASLSRQVANKKLSRVKVGKYTKFVDLRYIQIPSPLPISISLKTGLAVTGPNASGKTTLLKSVLGGTLIGQQFGYAPCKSCKICLYSDLHSYLNIVDSCDRDSVFEREARKCKDVLEAVQDTDSRHLCIFDELFSGTNPAEASAAGSSYLNHLSRTGRVDFLMTSHLTKLCEHLDTSNISNINMVVQKSEQGFEPTYGVAQGISYTVGANRVLQKMKFPSDIITRSEDIINEDSFVSCDKHMQLN
tara:strand:+ start:124 stop:1809 length:1686 start_codon:yes stop_codon:yes gene_type:complete